MPCRDALVAAVEGESSLMLLTIGEGKLALQHRISLPDMMLPTSLVLDSHRNLWAAGGCLDQLPFQTGFVQSPLLTNVRILINAYSRCLKKLLARGFCIFTHICM